MGKVSIGLRGWRFDEADVLDSSGRLKPPEEMPEDARERIRRLSTLVEQSCDACYLADREEPADAAVVYGEPLGEVVLCPDHEADFLYWYREEGGERFRGEEALQDAFHEWFARGGRAPEGYGGLDHVETDPEDLPDPPACSADLDLGADYPTG